MFMNAKLSRPQANLRTLRSLMVLVVSSILVFAGFLSFSRWSSVRANTPDINSARSRYPVMVGSRIDSCSLCHTGSIPALNSYGAAYMSNGRSPAALAAIESLDSDGDGFSNLVEITALTFPGDAADHPVAATATKVPPTATAIPPTATKVPPTATKIPPTATSIAPTATNPGPTATGVAPTATKVPPTLTPGPIQKTPTIVPSGTPTPPVCITHDYHRRGEKAKNKKCEIEDSHKDDQTVEPTDVPEVKPTTHPKSDPTVEPKHDVKDAPALTTPVPSANPKYERKHPTRGKHG
jgi:hypothetical protein